MRIRNYSFVLFLCSRIIAYINTIEIHGNHFYDSITNEPFFIRGVDYQPGGSSDVSKDKDPLSDPSVCSRDIPLFQELGINAVRVYSINPDLNHDKCMTMLATAGIYLILDVNSPINNEHLNRYEPWTTYNPSYLEHIFKVVEHFAPYNNTLGFIAGNEIINDKRSAERSPPYIKQLVSDMKQYIQAHAPRNIPVGYSAADDLKYRVSLSKYLECQEDDSSFSSVDFYGVNSYQWCGDQTFESSGYNKLVEAYENYSKPVFFSEFGCNEVTPRQFGEIAALYSDKMYKTFSGGLVYEFSQETNKYGLVSIDKNNNDVSLLEDFEMLKKQYEFAKLPTSQDLDLNNDLTSKTNEQKVPCLKKYANLDITSNVAPKMATEFIKRGVKGIRGQYVNLDAKDLLSDSKYFDSNGKQIDKKMEIKVKNQMGSTKKDNKQEKSRNAAQSISVSLAKVTVAIVIVLDVVLGFL